MLKRKNKKYHVSLVILCFFNTIRLLILSIFKTITISSFLKNQIKNNSIIYPYLLYSITLEILSLFMTWEKAAFADQPFLYQDISLAQQVLEHFFHVDHAKAIAPVVQPLSDEQISNGPFSCVLLCHSGDGLQCRFIHVRIARGQGGFDFRWIGSHTCLLHCDCRERWYCLLVFCTSKKTIPVLASSSFEVILSQILSTSWCGTQILHLILVDWI